MDWNKRSTYLLVKTVPGKVEEVWKKFFSWDHAIGSWVITGEWDIMVWFDTQTWDDVYKWASEVRSWEGVVNTSSHSVFTGLKEGDWWWQKPTGAWLMIRDSKPNANFNKLKEWSWIVSACSVPGDWDYIAWVSGNNWDEVWDHIWELNKMGWQTLTAVPIRSWWNTSWEQKWSKMQMAGVTG